MNAVTPGELEDVADSACEAQVVSADDGPTVTPGAGLAPSHGKLLKRSEVARRLGMSLSSVRRLEGKALSPIVGPKGVRYFEETEIQAVFVQIRQTRRSDARPDGALDAEVFRLFRQGLDAVDVVKRLRLAPDVVERLFQQWKRLCDTIVLDRRTAAELEKLLNSAPVVDARSLLDAIAEFKKSSCCHCLLCNARRAVWCRSCAREAGTSALFEQEAHRLF